MLSIIVDARTYDSLLRVAGKTLVAYAALMQAEKIVGLTATSPTIFVVRCDDAEARSLLAAAERDCPAAAYDIRLALSQARGARRNGGP